MRRRPKPLLDSEGNLLVLPSKFELFIADDWPGVTDYDRWEHWFEARCAWGRENNAPDSLMDVISAGESAPHWTEEDIARLI